MKKFVSSKEAADAFETIQHEYKKYEFFRAAIDLIGFERDAGEVIDSVMNDVVIPADFSPDFEKLEEASEIFFGQKNKKTP